MSEASASPFNPKRWTALTWLAVLIWAWHPFVLNFPPSASSGVNPHTGELSNRLVTGPSPSFLPRWWPLSR